MSIRFQIYILEYLAKLHFTIINSLLSTIIDVDLFVTLLYGKISTLSLYIYIFVFISNYTNIPQLFMNAKKINFNHCKLEIKNKKRDRGREKDSKNKEDNKRNQIKYLSQILFEK